MRYPYLNLGALNKPMMDSLEAAATKVIRSGRYIGGKECEDFEKKLSEVCHTDFAVGVASGLDALRIIFQAYKLTGRLAPGDEVIVPANTFIASVLAITQNGLAPVLAEPDPRTHNLDTSRLEKYISPRTRAILTVHLYGTPSFDSALCETARKHNLLVVEDNAQAIGADASCASPWGTTRTGSLGDAAAISFYPAKNIGALGDSGAITTSDASVAEIARSLSNYGSESHYHYRYQGWNSRLDPIQAAMLAVKLDYLDAETARRRENALAYDKTIINPLVTKPIQVPGAVWHQYVVSTDKRDAFRAYLESRGVETAIHYPIPPHLQPCYAGLRHGSLPVTEQLARTIVSLPISSATPTEDIEAISAIINSYQG